MSTTKKFAVSFILALTLHLSIVAMFGINFFNEPEVVKQKPLPEIIQASVLDDKTIMEEAERLKKNEKDKKIAQNKKQKELEDNRKREQELLQKAKKKRIKEEQKAKELEKKREQNEIKEKKLEVERKKRAKEEKVKEAARLAKIKKQKADEKKRLDRERKAKEAKRKADLKAKKKRKAELAAKQKAEAARKEAARKKREADAKAKAEQDRKATISFSDAIRKKVINYWIKPPSATKGMNCVISVKLLPSGDVMAASVTRSSGDSVFDRSAENAVRKASPLPVPKERNLFKKTFRSFNFNFKPE